MTIQAIDGPMILQGEFLSDAVDCRAGAVVAIIIPGGWEQAPLTFQISPDNITYYDMFGPDGREISCSARDGYAVTGFNVPGGWLKFRSGTREAPVIQGSGKMFFRTIVATMGVEEEAPPVTRKATPSRKAEEKKISSSKDD